ncbi:MAG: glycosyltransferase family 2 protein [Bacteroidetes bacterium]|nr:glycosyltransferase family 2 protein [Bacteroidota bacterium]
MNPKLSIIIVSYNVGDLLRACLLSIYNDSLKDIEVIVVDNNSTDGSVSMINENFKDVVVIKNKHNAGFPAANNQAIAIAKAQNIFLLNPDTVILDDALLKIYELLFSSKELKIIAPCLLNTDGSLQFSIQRFITVSEIWLEVFFLHNHYKRIHSYFNSAIASPVKVEAASGAALAFKRDVINKMGLLNEKMFWTEDMEFCYRASKNKIETWYYPDIKITHHIGESGKKNLSVMISNQVLTKINFFKENHSVISFYLVWTARLIHILSRLILTGVLQLFMPPLKIKFGAYLFTLKRFVRNDY